MRSMETAWFPLWLTAATALTPAISNWVMTGQQGNLPKSVELANHPNSPGNNSLDISSSFSPGFLPSLFPFFFLILSWHLIKLKANSFRQIEVLWRSKVLYRVQFWGDLKRLVLRWSVGKVLGQKVVGHDFSSDSLKDFINSPTSASATCELLPPWSVFCPSNSLCFYLFSA